MTVRLDRAFAIADNWVRDGIVPGILIAVARNGELLGTFAAGKRAAGGGGPVDDATFYSIASVSKPLVATLALRLVEQGVITLDEPVRRLLPYLGGDKRELCLRDLLRHTAGLSKDDPGEAELWAREAGFDELARSASAIPALEPAGQRVRYSNNGYWIVGAALSAAAGMSFADAMRAYVLEPFGLSETLIAPDESIQDRVARRYGKAKIMNSPYGRQLASPAGGLFATARDLVRFAEVFLNGGIGPDGARLLSRSSIALMTTSQTGSLPGGIEGFLQWSAGGWALGWEVKGHKTHHWTGDLTSPATFAHPGQAGTLLWADPATGLTAAILANRDLYTGWTINPARWARLCNAIVAAGS